MVDFVADYDEILQGTLQKYLSLSQAIGGVVKEQADLVHALFQAQRECLVNASKFKKPADNVLQILLQPTADKIKNVQAHREKNRTSEYFNHLSSVSEAITALGWIVVTPDPSKYAKELHAAGAYYGNKVITGYKDKNTTHSDWAKTWLQVLLDLHSYIREHHRCGLTWNMKGPVATADASVASSGGAPPPPPPPPPPLELFEAHKGSGDTTDVDSRAALFKEINRGADITRCLKKVDKSSPQQNARVAPIFAKHGDHAAKQSKPPRFELDGRKWCVEYQEKKELKIPDTTMNQSVCIYQCHNCVIHVENKVNCITLDSCKKTSIVFSDIVSFVEFINCQDMKAQSLGKVPTITIDKTDGVQVFMSNSSLDAEIISSKSSEINICVPTDDDYTEFAVPEQFMTTIAKKGLKTVVIEKA